MTAQNDALAVVLAVVIGLAATTVAALAGGVGPTPAAQQPAQTCAEWTDGCVVCSRTPQGLACSTPGIACRRGPKSCLRP